MTWHNKYRVSGSRSADLGFPHLPALLCAAHHVGLAAFV